MLNLVSGVYAPDAGRIELLGHDITALPPARRVRMGLGRSFQRSTVFERLPVLDNVMVAVAAQRRRHWQPWLRWHAQERVRAEDTLERVGLTRRAAAPAGSLSHGEKRSLEVAICLATRPKVLLLDEPTQGLSGRESVALTELIRDVVHADRIATVLVEHDMAAVHTLASRVMVLHQGRVLVEGAPEEIAASRLVREIYLGGETLGV